MGTNTKTIKTLGATIIVLILIIQAFGPTRAFAQDNSSFSSLQTAELQAKAKERVYQKLKEGTFFVLGIQSKIKQSGSELDLLRGNIDELQGKVAQSEEAITDIKEQLKNLDVLSELNALRLTQTKLVIAASRNEIYTLESDIQDRKDSVNSQLTQLTSALSTLYFQNNILFRGNDDSQLLALLSNDGSLGEMEQKQEYLHFLESAADDLAKEIIRNQLLLDEQKEKLEQKRTKLDELEQLLEAETRMLNSAKQAKQRLLAETEGRQELYENLLDLSRKDEANVSLEIQRLQENYLFFQAKLDEMKSSSPTATLDLSDATIVEAQEALESLRGETALAWPISPGLGISAFYHDAGYQKAMGVQHNAVDIRALQGSKLRAAADGVVTKTIDNGLGYSYIILAHAGKLLTLYGHVAEITVQEGQLVRQGQVIGLSGGMPGTKGAGWLTTGPHLHFEVFKNFMHVDPLYYLPLEYLPATSLPDKYFSFLRQDEDEKVKRGK